MNTDVLQPRIQVTPETYSTLKVAVEDALKVKYRFPLKEVSKEYLHDMILFFKFDESQSYRLERGIKKYFSKRILLRADHLAKIIVKARYCKQKCYASEFNDDYKEYEEYEEYQIPGRPLIRLCLKN